MLSPRNTQAAQRGFSLLEVLVTIVVFAVGLLGAGALQLVSKKATYDAIQRTGAAFLAADALERLRANGAALDQYLGAFAAGTRPAPGTDCEAGVCDAAELAAYDLWLLSEAIAGNAEVATDGTAGGGLVDAVMCVTGPADGSSGFYEVAIVWRGRGAMADRSGHACGAGGYGTDEQFRRLLAFTSFVEAT